MAHHVVQHAAALQCAPPEPWLVWSTVFLGRSSQVWATRKRHTSVPDDVTSDGNRGGKELILEVAMADPNAAHQFQDTIRFSDISRERLLTRQTVERSAALLDRADDLLNIFHARVIGTAEPYRLNSGIRHHFGDRPVHRGSDDL